MLAPKIGREDKNVKAFIPIEIDIDMDLSHEDVKQVKNECFLETLFINLYLLYYFKNLLNLFLQAMVVFQELRIQANNKREWIVAHIFTPN